MLNPKGRAGSIPAIFCPLSSLIDMLHQRCHFYFSFMRSSPVLSAMKGDSEFTCVNHMFVCKTFPSEAGEEYTLSRHASSGTWMAAFIFSLFVGGLIRECVSGVLDHVLHMQFSSIVCLCVV